MVILPLHNSVYPDSSDLLHSLGYKNPKFMCASAAASVRQLTSVRPSFLQSSAWPAVLSRDQNFLFSREDLYMSLMEINSKYGPQYFHEH